MQNKVECRSHRFIHSVAQLFRLILELCRLRRLPLHVARSIGAASLQWRNVINYITRTRARFAAGRRAWMGPLKVVLCIGTARYPPVVVSSHTNGCA